MLKNYTCMKVFNSERQEFFTQFLEFEQMVKQKQYLDAHKKLKEIQSSIFYNNIHFYSLVSRFKCLCTQLYFQDTKYHHEWFRESIHCLSPEYYSYLPKEFFRNFLDTINLKGSNKFLPDNFNFKINSNEINNPFLKVNLNFFKDYIFENEKILVNIEIQNLINIEIPEFQIQIVFKNYENNKKVQVDELIPNKFHLLPLSNFKYQHEVQREFSYHKVKFRSFGVMINDVIIYFPISSEFSHLYIEPKRNICSLTSHLPPFGIVYIPSSICLNFCNNENYKYTIILHISSDNNIKLSISQYGDEELPSINKIKFENNEQKYSFDFYIKCFEAQIVNLNIEWYLKINKKEKYHTKQIIPIPFLCPFLLQTNIYNKYRTLIYYNQQNENINENEDDNFNYKRNNAQNLLYNFDEYYLYTKFKANLSLDVRILSFEIEPETSFINFSQQFLELPISLLSDEEFSSINKFSISKEESNNEEKVQIGKIKILYEIESDIFTEQYHYEIPLSKFYIKEREIDVNFNFPSSGSQFEMCELELEIINTSQFPIEIIFNIDESSEFAMFGLLNSQIAIFPLQPHHILLRFFPLSHGTLNFPTISIYSAEDSRKCYWKSSPQIFIVYPTAS